MTTRDPSSLLGSILMAALLVAICLCWGSCQKWKYEECRAVGHSSFYCSTKALGCH